MIIANGLIFINPMIDKMFASFLPEGSVAILSYAEKIYLLPVSTFLTTYAVALLPDLSELVKKQDHFNVNLLLNRSIALNIILSIIVSILFFVYKEQIVGLVYGIVNMSDGGIEKIVNVLEGYIPSIIFAGSNSIVLSLYFAQRWYNKLILYSVSLFVLKLIFNSVIVYNEFGIRYIAFGTSVLMMLSFSFLIVMYKLAKKKIN